MQALFAPRANAGSVPVTNTEAQLQDKVDQWRDLAEVYGVSLPAVAIAFAALPSVVDKLVIGMRHEDEVATVRKSPCIQFAAARDLSGNLRSESVVQPIFLCWTMNVNRMSRRWARRCHLEYGPQHKPGACWQ